jgi:hypothetical protein
VSVPTCPFCDAPLADGCGPLAQVACPICHKPLPKEITRELRRLRLQKIDEDLEPGSNQPPSVESQDLSAIGTLKVIAWLTLIGGVIVAVVLWANKPTREPDGSYQIFLGIGVLGTGIVQCVFFLVVCKIADLLTEMRDSLRSIQASVKPQKSSPAGESSGRILDG